MFSEFSLECFLQLFGFIFLIKKKIYFSSDFTENIVVPYQMRAGESVGLCRTEVAAVMDSLSN